MSTSRRNVLRYSLAASLAVALQKLAFAAPSAAAKEELAGDLQRRINLFMREAEVAGIPIPAAAPGDAELRSFAGDMSAVIQSALEKNTSDDAILGLLDEGGLLLSQINSALVDLPTTDDFAGAPPSFDVLKTEYKTLFNSARVNQGHRADINRAVRTILSPRAIRIYKGVQQDTGIPWYVVGALHYRESSLNFMGHLHNGDFLKLKTVQVPKNRPRGPWPPSPWNPEVAWRKSAADALGTLARNRRWTVERMLYTFEGYNGWGYRSRGANFRSPYVWNYTQHYTGGGFPRDHVFSATYRSKQSGLAAVILALADMAPAEVSLTFE